MLLTMSKRFSSESLRVMKPDQEFRMLGSALRAAFQPLLSLAAAKPSLRTQSNSATVAVIRSGQVPV